MIEEQPNISSTYTSNEMILVPATPCNEHVIQPVVQPVIEDIDDHVGDNGRPILGKFLPKDNFDLNVTKFQWVEIRINITGINWNVDHDDKKRITIAQPVLSYIGFPSKSDTQYFIESNMSIELDPKTLIVEVLKEQ
ncbi:18962_t:CDS:2, partial [Racocetra persica]